MKKIIVVCALCVCFMCSAFAATSSLINDEVDCHTQCPAKSPRGCKLSDCSYSDSGSLLCYYPHDCNSEED